MKLSPPTIKTFWRMIIVIVLLVVLIVVAARWLSFYQVLAAELAIGTLAIIGTLLLSIRRKGWNRFLSEFCRTPDPEDEE